MNIILFISIYVFLIVAWLILNLIFYSISILVKKNLSTIPHGLNSIVNFLIGLYLSLYPFYLAWQSLINKQWLFLFLIFIVGSFFLSILSSIISLLIVPFHIISGFFSMKAGLILSDNGQEFDVEYISPGGKIIEKTSSESKQNKNLAIFFLLSFTNNLFYILLRPNQYHTIGLDYIFTPGFFMLQNAIIMGIPLGVINFIRFKNFIHPSWKVFLANVFKIELVLIIGIQVIATIYVFVFE